MWKTAPFLLLALALPSSALAWGAEGHQIVASIAASELTPAARDRVRELLGADPGFAMTVASTWADEIRPQHPETAPWHYVNIPVGSTSYDARRDCPRGDCVVEQIEREQRIISDRTLLPAVRAEALRFLIHFIGDIHQPLHAADNRDRGGNEMRVVLNGRRTNMHAVWDVDVVRALGGDALYVASQLEADMSAAKHQSWQNGAAATWANESFRLARAEIYAGASGRGASAPIVLSADYARQESGVAAEQLEKAGVRLAWVLNRALQ
jgi:hypothetical protein